MWDTTFRRLATNSGEKCGLGVENRGELKTGEVGRFIVQLERLPLLVDLLTSQQAFSRTLSLARAYKLSSYDAAFLELAVREGLPIATLD
jgi:predicted nucleic acid-binding protein